MSRAASSWTRFSEGLLDLLYPRRCPLCDAWSDESPCASCCSDMVPAEPGFRTGDGSISGYATLFDYTGRAAEAVKRLKYGRRTSLAAWMSSALARRYDEIGDPVDAVVPVPIHWTRRCMRGFNQSQLLCEAFPPELVRPELLVRVRATRPQARLSHDERLENLKGAFQSRPVPGLRVLLIDDVLTSGQTARECASALLSAGASEVSMLAFAGE